MAYEKESQSLSPIWKSFDALVGLAIIITIIMYMYT